MILFLLLTISAAADPATDLADPSVPLADLATATGPDQGADPSTPVGAVPSAREVPLAEAPAPGILPAEVAVTFQAPERGTADLWIGGTLRVTLSGGAAEVVRISPGQHRVALHERGGETPFTWGTVDTGLSERIALGVDADRQLACFDCPAFYAGDTPPGPPLAENPEGLTGLQIIRGRESTVLWVDSTPEETE